jgi:[acyl-carrier-protein] S-malonyltransferase
LKSIDPVSIWGDTAPKRMRLIPLQVSAPFHCALMKPAEERMRDVLEGLDFQVAQFPIIQNWTAQSETQPKALRESLVRQVSGSVRWMQSMALAAKYGWLDVIEVGHGKVLQGLLKKIDPRFNVQGTSTLDELKAIEKETAKGTT